jgi:hypothetical protein
MASWADLAASASQRGFRRGSVGVSQRFLRARGLVLGIDQDTVICDGGFRRRSIQRHFFGGQGGAAAAVLGMRPGSVDLDEDAGAPRPGAEDLDPCGV